MTVLPSGNSRVYEVPGRPSALWVMLSPAWGWLGRTSFSVQSVLTWTHCGLLGQVIRKLNVCCGPPSWKTSGLTEHPQSLSVAGETQPIFLQPELSSMKVAALLFL